MRISDWSSDVCSSDLLGRGLPLIDGGRIGIFERQILYILRDQPDRRAVVLAVGQRFGGEFGCGLVGHGIGLSTGIGSEPLALPSPSLDRKSTRLNSSH